MISEEQITNEAVKRALTEKWPFTKYIGFIEGAKWCINQSIEENKNDIRQ